MLWYRRSNSIRARGHDYRNSGAYLVTVCAAGRLQVFGTIQQGRVWLTELGALVEEEWASCSLRRDYVSLDESVIMPNHFHGILWLTKSGPHPEASTRCTLVSGSLGAIVGQFKSRVNRRAVSGGLWDPNRPLWQRGFHDRIIRSEDGLNLARWYIRANPIRWERGANGGMRVEATRRVAPT